MRVTLFSKGDAMYFKHIVILSLTLFMISCQSEMYVSEIEENDEILIAMKSVNEMEQTLFGLSENSLNKIIYANRLYDSGSHKNNSTSKHTIKVDFKTKDYDRNNVCVIVQHELLHHIGYKHTDQFYIKLAKLNLEC